MSTTQIRTSWAPHRGQQEILESPARFRIVACGRRWGKTEMCAQEAVRYLGKPNTLVWWVAPTYDIADIGFDKVETAAPANVIEGEPKLTKPKALEFQNGSRISFRSADREDSLRGEGLDLLVLDEAAMIPERAWANELRPTLSDTLGDMIAISTPKGRGWFYRWFERGESEDYPDADCWKAPTSENPHILESEIDAARRELPQRVFEQEYEAKFVDESGGVFEQLDERLFTADYDLPLSPLPEGPDDRVEGVAYGEPPFTTGVDFARHQDWRVTITLDAAGRVVYFDRDQHEAWPQIQTAVENVADQYPGVVAVDASRDNKIVADLERAGVNVDPVKFSPSTKQDLIEDLIASVEGEELTAPEIPQLRHELALFEYEVTPSGNVRYQAPEGFHDDTVDALALAVSGLGKGQIATATARMGEEESEERQQFRESEIGQAVSQFEQARRSR